MPVSSMTGFGIARGRLSPRVDAEVAIRSVNHRFRDIQLRFSSKDEGPELESLLKKIIEDFVVRGRVSVMIDLKWKQAPPANILWDREAIKKLQDEISSIGEIRPGEILALPGLVTVISDRSRLDEKEIQALELLATQAGKEFRDMRIDEAGKLVEQIRADLAEIEAFTGRIEQDLPVFRHNHFQSLKERLADFLKDQSIDEARLIQEAAILADRADIAEEVLRLKTHLDAFNKRLDAGGAVGRSLDFLCQELHREVNTLGTKCRETGITEKVIDAKGAIERIREQVQNIE